MDSDRVVVMSTPCSRSIGVTSMIAPVKSVPIVNADNPRASISLGRGMGTPHAGGPGSDLMRG